MKKLAIALAAATAAGIGFAATPIAVWDGDFTVEHTGFTLNRSGNALSEDKSTITIDQDVGVKVDFSTGFSDAMTVMFKYSDLSFDAQKTIATSFCSGGDENRTGVYLASGGTANGIWNTADWAHPGSALSASSGVFAFSYNKNSGTGLYYIDNAGARTQLFFNSGLKASGDSAINGCAIGGERAKSGATLLSAATGMKITGIAIFNGVLTESEMTGYVWPSDVDTIAVGADTTISALNTLIAASSGKKVVLSVTSGVTITADTPFVASVPVEVSSTGNVTLNAETQPDASYFTAVDFSGVQGALLRSWLSTPGVAGFNFRSANGSDVSGALIAGENWIHDNNSANGTSTAMFADGLSTLTWSSANTWACSGSTIISGYLDDGANGGNGAAVTLSNVPYETYDVIVYCSSDSDPGMFLAKTVNGTTYTWDTSSGTTVAGNSVWGKAAISIPVYGVNALRVKNLSGPLTIYGTARNGSNRGGIAAIQIMPPGTPDNIRTYTLTLNGTATTWSSGTWTLEGNSVDAPASGYVEIVATASTELTVDTDVSLADLKVIGSENVVVNVATNDTGSLYAIKATVESGVFQQGSPAVLGATPTIAVEDGATFDMNGLAIDATTKVYLAGDGAGNWPWALTSSSGAGGAILGGLYLSANASIGGANELKVGQTQSGYQCYLQGFTLTKIGTGAFTCTNMNTPGTGTIDVQGGAMSVNQWNNLNNNGGNTTVILHSGTSLANGTDRTVPVGTLKLLGGTLTTTRAFKVNTLLVGAGETANLAFADGASASLTGDLTVTAALTLDGAMTFNKDANAANDVVVTASGTMSSSGAISVGAGVTLNLGTNRPTGEITVDDDATLSVRLQGGADVVSLSVSAQPANLVVYDENGDELSDPRVTYSNGTLTIMAQLPTLPASDTVAFDTAANWENSLMPTANGDAIIELSADATITVSANYTLGSLTISGAGAVSFTGTGSIAAANISLKNGATLTSDSKISATATVEIDSGTVLKLDGLTVPAVISGAGAVETYGDVVFTTNNTFTGGLTVKSGTTSTTAKGGFAGKESDGIFSVVVEDGGCLDIANTRDYTHSLTIAGKGVLLQDGTYSGAVKNSGNEEFDLNKRQTRSITLSADAMVDVSTGWGIIRSSHYEAALVLNGHTLTMRGTGTVPMANVNASSSSGTLVLDGATLHLGSTACNLTGVNVIAKGCASIKIETAPTAIGSLTVKPSATGTTASNWSLPDSPLPIVDTSNIDTTGLTDGQVLTIFTAPSALSASTISVQAGGRFTAVIDGATVKATYSAGMPANFLHYDFDNGAAVDTGKAADSGTQISSVGEAGSVTLVNSKNGQAVQVHAGYTPYWDALANGTSPFHAGEVTVTTVAKLRQTGIILWGLGAASSNTAMGLVAEDAHTVSVVARKGTTTTETLATMTVAEDLTQGWHFYAVVATELGTTLYVDNLSVTSAAGFITGIGQQGQLGSFHGGAFGGNKAGINSGAGYLLDDWRIYDAALTRKEIRQIKASIAPDPFRLYLR